MYHEIHLVYLQDDSHAHVHTQLLAKKKTLLAKATVLVKVASGPQE